MSETGSNTATNPNPNYYANPALGAQPMYNNYYGMDQGMNQPYFNGQPYNYGAAPTPRVMNNALTNEEISELQNMRPSGTFDLNISKQDYLRSMCTHKDANKRDVVQMMVDGTNRVYCPICGATWVAEAMTKEEITELINTLIDQMQLAKWCGDFPTQLVREYFSIIPMLEKYPDLHEYALNNFNKMYNQFGPMPAQEAGIYAQYNSMFGNNMNGYGYMNQPQGYYGQPMQQGQPYMNQPVNGYMPQGQVANPGYNPMQTPYGVNMNQPSQFNNQAAQMMPGGSVYGQPYTQQPVQQPYNPQMNPSPVYGVPQQSVAPEQTTTPNGATVTTDPATGTTTSENKVTL